MQLSLPPAVPTAVVIALRASNEPTIGLKARWPFKVGAPAPAREVDMKAQAARVLATTRRQWWP